MEKSGFKPQPAPRAAQTSEVGGSSFIVRFTSLSMLDTNDKPTTIDTIPVEILLDIIAVLLHEELDDGNDTAIRIHILPFRHACPAVLRVWTFHSKALLHRVALERLAILKPRALVVRRTLVRTMFRRVVRRAVLKLAPPLGDPADERDYRKRLASQEMFAFNDYCDAAWDFMRVGDQIFNVKPWMSPGYRLCQVDWAST
ncbi:hypothetical protein FN846DRAFT_895087 [Sphaerosporella brunnea]|uniref:Uncharacterized protein n=1 Tax=Sphaerosporella brunnea TaxID=1250544 RepID=A0A5J5EGK9_9PEZI|nr:hypothetical protein FN846DRAFT_895087 [Sphaerosporella brunnea]